MKWYYVIAAINGLRSGAIMGLLSKDEECTGRGITAAIA